MPSSLAPGWVAWPSWEPAQGFRPWPASPFMSARGDWGRVASGGRREADVGRRPRPRRLGRVGWVAVAGLVACVLIAAGWISWRPLPRSVPPAVRLSASEVLLDVPDIPEPGWGAWSSGTNGSGAWRFFAVHSELILATLNVTLWVEGDAAASARRMESLALNISYATQDGGVPGSDASLLWFYSFGQYAGMVVRRYNVVFVLSAHLETSFSLTPSDLAKWSDWQLAKVESSAL